MLRDKKSLLIGLGLPAVGILIVLPLVANTSGEVLGVPLLFFWMFLLFPLTTVCLWVAWRIDEPHYRDDTRPAPHREDAA